MNIEIRKATANDASKVIDFCKKVGSETDNLSYGSEGIGSNIDRIAKYLDNVYNSKTSVFLIAIIDNEVVGYAEFMGMFRKRLSHLGEIGIAVIKEYQNKKIGSNLMKQLIYYVKNDINAEIIELKVRVDNEKAINMYKKFGFKKIGYYEKYLKVDDKYFDCDIMTLCLKR